MEKVAHELVKEKIDVEEGPSDPYSAQLAKSKAAKVESAEKLLERASKDPKVQKAINKKATGRAGKGRGRGRGRSTSVPSDDKGGDASGGTGDQACDHGDQNMPDPAPNCSAEPSLQDAWKEKETITYNMTCVLTKLYCVVIVHPGNKNLYLYKICMHILVFSTVNPESIRTQLRLLTFQEQMLKAAGVPIPDGAGARKSFTIKPPPNCKDGAGSLGILLLVCNLAWNLLRCFYLHLSIYIYIKQI